MERLPLWKSSIFQTHVGNLKVEAVESSSQRRGKERQRAKKRKKETVKVKHNPWTETTDGPTFAENQEVGEKQRISTLLWCCFFKLIKSHFMVFISNTPYSAVNKHPSQAFKCSFFDFPTFTHKLHLHSSVQHWTGCFSKRTCSLSAHPACKNDRTFSFMVLLAK